jgi:hypothetical protein
MIKHIHWVFHPLKLQQLSDGFYNHSSGMLDGCVMAIDGFGVATRQPFKSEFMIR